MPWLQRRFWYVVLISPLLVISATGILVGTSRLYQSAYYGKLYGANILWLAKGGDVKQEFVSNYPGLTQVDVFVTAQGSAPDEAPVTFHLRSSCQAASDLRTQVALLPGDKIDGQAFYTFQFAPLAESSGQRYCFILTSDKPGDDKNLIGILASQANAYLEGRAYYDQPPLASPTADIPKTTASTASLSGTSKLFLPIVRLDLPNYDNIDVAFQIQYDSSYLSTAEVFFTRLVEHKPYIWGQPAFYITLLVIYAFGITILISLVIWKAIINKK